jgi:hypothetical protein
MKAFYPLRPLFLFITLFVAFMAFSVISISHQSSDIPLPPEPAVTEKRDNSEELCMIEALWYEARGESDVGQIMVGQVIFNRMDSTEFPNTVCDVVHQKNEKTCQFSYYCDGKSDKIEITEQNINTLNRVEENVKTLFYMRDREINLAKGMLYFSSSDSTKGLVIGEHTFR